MKKSKLIFSALVLALTLVFTSVATTNTYADTSDPQGVVESKKAPPPPPPPPDSGGNPLVSLWAMIIGLFS
jgi:hypothetical protein